MTHTRRLENMEKACRCGELDLKSGENRVREGEIQLAGGCSRHRISLSEKTHVNERRDRDLLQDVNVSNSHVGAPRGGHLSEWHAAAQIGTCHIVRLVGPRVNLWGPAACVRVAVPVPVIRRVAAAST